MEERNGEVFDHTELFAQIGVSDLIMESAGLPDTNEGLQKSLADPGGTSQDNSWTHAFGCSESGGLVLNHGRNPYYSVPPIEMPLSEENTNAFFESLVKNMPNSDPILDHYGQHNADKKPNPNTRPALVGHHNHEGGAIFDGLPRISTDKVTQEFLDNLNRLEPNELLGKCNDFDSITWNGAMCDPVGNSDFQQQNRPGLHGQSSIDKNGNSAVFNNTHGDKVRANFGPSPSEQAPHNFITRLSPSASVESNVHTPTTSYESASPLSSNRTPIRSDESISPMGSGHTPLRMDDSTSPLASVKTPMRADEGSPMGRTPLRTEEGFSPAGMGTAVPSRADTSPSHKPNGQTPQRFENYSSPPSVPKKPEVKSPPSCSLRSPSGSCPKPGQEGSEDVAEIKEEYSSPENKPDAAIPSLEALIKKNTNKKILIPFVSATRIDDPVVPKKAAKRTFPRKSDSELHLASSSLPGKSESDSDSPVTNQVSGIKTETEVPETEKDKSRDDAQKLTKTEAINSCTEDTFAKSKKRRKNTDNLCLPTAKRRCRKKVTIYQSSMSPEESGIKMMIKLAPTFQRPKPQKKRKSKKQLCSDDEDGGRPNKKTKKSVRFSSGTKEPEKEGKQTDWGSNIPPAVLHRIFQLVVEDQGCVPSLVRLSSVCKLWNTVANRSDLWQNIDLSSPYIKQRCRIDRYFRWLLENRLEGIQDLNLNGWKFSNITMILSLIGTHCTEIESIGLAGWQGLHYEHLKSLLQDCPRLAKLDLSDVSPESKSANSAVSQKSVTFLTQEMGERLTQLILAHNTLTCLPQIISSLATHCPNLQVLDLSNIRRVSHTEFALNIEHLQEGCQRLRVLRITNSCVTLANVPLEKQVASPGFANLEELSIAGHQGTESLRITSVMDDNCLERILKTSHKLRLLDVRGCTRITDSSLVRVPAWEIQHLFLSGCYVTRQSGSGLELIAQKWSHSLVEIDLAWTTVTEDLNAAVMAFAEKGSESPLRIMNLCGSSVTLDPVKAVLTKCPNLESLNLQSCRGLPRGVKRLYENEQLIELRNMLEKKDRDSVSEGEERKDECEDKQSPARSTNTKDDDLFT